MIRYHSTFSRKSLTILSLLLGPLYAAQMHTILLKLLETFPTRVSILLKNRLSEEHPVDGWYRRWHAYAKTAQTHKAVADHSAFIFECAGYVLCLRKEDQSEYIALDEFGVLFYYTNSTIVYSLFEEAGFKFKQHDLVSDAPHYWKSFDQEEEWRDNFITQLDLEEVHQTLE